MSMVEYDALMTAIFADLSCAPMLADRFQEAGLESTARNLRCLDTKPGFTSPAWIAYRVGAFFFTSEAEEYQATLYGYLYTRPNVESVFYCCQGCYWVKSINGVNDYVVERRS